MKEHKPDVRVVAVEPPAGELVQGLRNLDDGFVPPIFDPSVLDRKLIVRPRDSIEWTRRLLEDCGVFAGISSGAAVAGAVKTAAQMDHGTIVTLLPDGGWKYLSSGAWTDPIEEVVERATRINYWWARQPPCLQRNDPARVVLLQTGSVRELDLRCRRHRAGGRDPARGWARGVPDRDRVRARRRRVEPVGVAPAVRGQAAARRPSGDRARRASGATRRSRGSTFPRFARVLARACWPGPLTLVVRRRPGAVADEATGGRDTVGVRVPDHPMACALLDAFGGAVAAPSANRFGKVSPTTAQHVRDDLGDDVDLVLDGGPCAVGVESTIVDVTATAGRAARRRCRRSTPRRARVAAARPVDGGEIAASGTLPSHYAPNARVELVHAHEVAARTEILRTSGRRVGVLDAPQDAAEYARVLYARLREADAPHVDVISRPSPKTTARSAPPVRDRLERAARG